jgi:hypothetical protein
VGTGSRGIVSGMTQNPRTPETPAAPAGTTPAPAPGAAGPAAAPAAASDTPAPPSAPAPDASAWSAPPPAAAEPARSAPWRRFGRWITAAVLIGVLLVGGVGGFAIGRATAPEGSGPFGVERPGGGRMPGGDGAGELPEPPSDRSGQDSSDQGSASDGTTDGAATGTSTTT